MSNYYYDISKRGFAQEVVPQKIFSGQGHLPFGEGADLRRSKIRGCRTRHQVRGDGPRHPLGVGTSTRRPVSILVKQHD